MGARHLGPHPPLERGGARHAARHGGRAARRLADACQRPGPGVLRAPRARRAAAGRAEQHAGVPGHVRPLPRSLQRGRRLEARDVARARRARQRPGRRSRSSRATSSPRKTRSASCSAGRRARFRAAQPMYEQPVAPTVPAGLPSALLERRPDLRQAEQQLVAANARIGVAKAEFFPKLSLTALFGAASPELSALTGGSATVWAVAGHAQRAALQRRPHAGNYKRVHRAMGAGAAPVRAGGPGRAPRGLGLSHRARQAERRRDGTGHRGEGARGRRRCTRRIDTARGWPATTRCSKPSSSSIPAQNTLAQIRRNRLVAYVQLYKALGGGWKFSDADWTGPKAAAAGDSR